MKSKVEPFYSFIGLKSGMALKLLTKQSGGDKRSILTPKEKKKHVYSFIDKKSKTEAVQYAEVKNNIESKTGKSPEPRTVRRYGHSLKITSKKRKRVLKSEGLAFVSSCILLFAFN